MNRESCAPGRGHGIFEREMTFRRRVSAILFPFMSSEAIAKTSNCLISTQRKLARSTHAQEFVRRGVLRFELFEEVG